MNLSITLIVAIYISLVSAVNNSTSLSDYAPRNVQCPSSNITFIREANSISTQEQEWIQKRREQTNPALIEFLNSANMTGFNAQNFINGNTSSNVSIALAFSGGGYRAMLNGAGQIAALDNRTNFGSNNTGGLGGILQSATYLSALSGGSWMVGSIVLNNFSSVQDIVFNDTQDLWNLTETRQLVNQTGFYGLVADVVFGNLNKALTHLNWWGTSTSGIDYDITSKQKAGYNLTLTDYWGRGLSYQLLSSPDGHGAGTTWSSIRDLPQFSSHSMPFPILIALGRKPDTIVYNINNTVIEFNPFEMGSFDPSLNTFTDMKYIGTNVTNGKPTKNTCVTGFDNAGFVMGTSSSLFNEFLNTLVCEDCHSLNFIVKPILKYFLDKLSGSEEDVANYTPNPFYKSQYAQSNNITDSDTLYLIDGGLGGEVIPLSSVLNTERDVDVAFAFDSSNDTPTNWPNGSALVQTYERQFSEQGKTTIVPYVPDTTTFLAHNLTARPVFFGCNASNLTDLVKDNKIPPLVIYMANRPFEYYSNTSTFKLTYEDDEKKSMIKNGFDLVTQLNGTIDSQWKTCVACAVIRREEERRGIQQTDQCKKCFESYCWDGTRAKVTGNYYAGVNFTDTGLTNATMELNIKASAANTASLLNLKRDESAAPKSALINFSLSFVLFFVTFSVIL